MKVLIDTCALSLVFGGNEDYQPVADCVTSGSGKMVIGGTKYRAEIAGVKKYMGVILELARMRRVFNVDDLLVDVDADRISRVVNHPDFDDSHIVALLNISNCKVLCTADARSDRFVQDRNLYNHPPAPSIYRRRDHRHLLRRG